ncbi:MAG: hypothetical protein A2X02_09095 [Bacteroidetes bacterium GWF2_29_10]|nr:MAG: hypothetical protein A2X02_09095 [Bacteroidetes bacterium GWF2_29_10]
MQAVVENYLKYKELSAKFPNFIFNSYDFEIKNNGLDIQFEFIIEDLVVFNPKIKISYSNSLLNTDKNIIENLVFNIGMIELISYWKTTCSKNIIINNILINEKQIKWWKNLYYNGLGEFIYLNGLSEKCNIENLFNFQVRGNKTFDKFNYKHHNRTLVPIGGGKDSVVTTMMMKEVGRDIQFLIINPRKATIDTVITAKYTEDDIITINRQIDSKLLDLNSKGFLNGHTPFSAMLSFYSILVAYLYGYTDIALSNESSANEPTIPNTQINHQYSKSIDYENAFRTYCSQYISPDFNYYSFLRQLNELQIVQNFSKYPQFFDVFKSCNVGSKNDTWCCNCPKCLFTYIMLSAFIDDEQLINIFGENLLNKESMIEYYEQLAGIVYVKPFECVGTVEEVNIALNAAIKIRKNQKLPLILELYSKI